MNAQSVFLWKRTCNLHQILKGADTPERLSTLDGEARGEATDVGGQLPRQGREGIQRTGKGSALPKDTYS